MREAVDSVFDELMAMPKDEFLCEINSSLSENTTPKDCVLIGAGRIPLGEPSTRTSLPSLKFKKSQGD